MVDLKTQRMKLERDAFMSISSLLENQEPRADFDMVLTPSWKLCIEKY